MTFERTAGEPVMSEESGMRRFDRRQFVMRAAIVGLSFPAVVGLLAACAETDDIDDVDPGVDPDDDTDVTTDDEPTDDQPDDTEVDDAPDDDDDVDELAGEGVRGGTLYIAIAGEPPTLDIHQSTAGIISHTVWCMYEPLFAWDADYQAIPMLAEGFDVSDDGLLITLRLRQGVNFHNGDEMTAEDVIASIERWGSISGLGGGLLDATSSINEVDDYTVEFEMNEPYGTFATTLCLNYQGCSIHPRAMRDEFGTDMITGQYIGTGPYQFVEHQPDRFIRMERFDDYSALPGEPDGYGGHKYAYLDELEFIPVPEAPARLSGLQSGDYHYLGTVSSDDFETLQGDDRISTEKLPPTHWDTLILNWQSPLMENETIRQAFQASLDHEPILLATEGEGFYRLDPSIMMRETIWATDAGSEKYDMNDPELAGELLEEGGYDGSPVRILTTQEYMYLYNMAAVANQQINDAGFESELEVYDWATVVERRGNPELWDVFTTSDPFRPDPTLMATMQLCNFPGWWCSEDSMALMEDLRQESDFDTRFEIWEQIQENFYTEVPMIKVGDGHGVTAMSVDVGGFEPMTQLTVAFWNMWLED